MSKLKSLLRDAEFVDFGHAVSGSRIYLPAGWRVRSGIVHIASSSLVDLGFGELHLPDLLDRRDVERLDLLAPISDHYYRVDVDRALAATHEAALFPFALRWFGQNSKRTQLRVFHVGSAYRLPKSAPSPFNFGERVGFVEAYALHRDRAAYARDIDALCSWTRTIVIDQLGLPSLQVRRPRYGNLPFAAGTITLETLLPVGRTFCTGMVYAQDERLTTLYDASTRVSNIVSAHAAVTDNLLYAYLASCADEDGFRLHRHLAEHDVLLSAHVDCSSSEEVASKVEKRLIAAGIRVLREQRSSRKAAAARRRFLLRGIPVLLVVPRGSHGQFTVTTRTNSSSVAESRVDVLDTVVDYLRNHDQLLNKQLETLLGKSVCVAETPGEASDIAASGMVAKFGLEENENAVVRLTALLRCGEVLGFDQLDRATVPSILNGATGRWCYASKRI